MWTWTADEIPDVSMKLKLQSQNRNDQIHEHLTVCLPLRPSQRALREAYDEPPVYHTPFSGWSLLVDLENSQPEGAKKEGGGLLRESHRVEAALRNAAISETLLV